MKRPSGLEAGTNPKSHFTDKEFSKKFPHIVEMMTDAAWDDKKPREVSTLSLNFGSGTVTVGLSDHALQRSAYSSADTVQEALSLLEEALASGRSVWRPWKANRGR